MKQQWRWWKEGSLSNIAPTTGYRSVLHTAANTAMAAPVSPAISLARTVCCAMWPQSHFIPLWSSCVFLFPLIHQCKEALCDFAFLYVYEYFFICHTSVQNTASK